MVICNEIMTKVVEAKYEIVHVPKYDQACNEELIFGARRSRSFTPLASGKVLRMNGQYCRMSCAVVSLCFLDLLL